ncbi:MAG TPA: dienelactone hydrolase family protein [Candidatus Cybelea sp.]|nr:dienelactone hydrolase family protein [Candidatus Cybelea sp.]
MESPEIDPMRAVSPALNRRAFVAISTGATIAVSAGAEAQEEFGRPHPPLVAETDPAIATQHVSLQRGDGTVAAYAAWPVSAGAHTPSVVVIMHIWGVDTSIRDFVRRLAKAGFAAIAPDLYARFGAPNGDGATDYTIFRPYATRLERDVWLGDVRAAAQWLSQKFPGTKIAITGFCMGGKLALIAATDEDGLFSVVAPFYGDVAGLEPTAFHIPLCGSYGGRDTGIPAAKVEAFAAALTVPNDVRVYDEAGHAFFDDQRNAYVASAAADAWTRTIACFNKYLAGGNP